MIGLHECPAQAAGPTPPRAPPSVRERAAQAVDYYNSQVLRARVNAGLAGPRAGSYNDRHHHHGAPGATNTSTPTSSASHNTPTASAVSRRHHLTQESLYRSNSSLELQDHHHHHADQSSPTLRREYGSHGSIDVIGSDSRPGPIAGTSESFFAMLQDYRPAALIGTDQRSPGPSEYLRSKVDLPPNCHEANTLTSTEDISERVVSSSTSPKLRQKFQKFWNNSGVSGMAHKSIRQSGAIDDSVVNTSNNNSVSTTSADIEERQRRRAFAHFDCQSLTANLGYAAKLRGLLLARRRNTTTGASAASMLNARSSTPDGDSGDEDCGDGHSNDLLESCPFFRNEIGGEEERVVSLTRIHSSHKSAQRRPLHRPPLAYGVAVLEFPSGETHWRHATCPYQRLPRPIESVDQGALYYRKHFLSQEHQNWFGMDEQLGPVAISIKREKLTAGDAPNHQYQYRLVIRTSELLTLRGAILEDAIPNLKSTSSNKSMSTKEVLEYVAPEVQLNCLRLGAQAPQTEEQLLKLDEQGLTSHYKVGIMYCKAGQASEEEMYNNEDAGPAFLEFLDCIGQRVRLKGFDKYKAGLDNKTDSTGLYSVYSQYQDCEIMFHVSTMLPFTPNNRQQLLRKRHIGNDIVTIVFQEPGAQPFTPKNIRSQFQHVFIVVRAINPCTENTHYTVAVSRSKEVPVFGPPIKDGAVFPKSKTFADFLLAKVVNAENAAHRSEKFATMATRTRQEYLKDLANNYSTTTMIETGQKFSIFSSKKKEKPRPAFISDASQRGAICWQVILDDSGQSMQVECFLGISTDTLVLVEECSRQIVFVTPCKSILGWSAQTNSLRIYHHQGECTTIHMRDTNYDRDELMEIMDRLKAVTNGCLTQELSLRRNPLGQLGFHVQPDGVVTQVESMGLAWQAGLRQGARLVEICKVAVSTLSHDQMVDLLKTSILVTVTVIPPLPDNQPRRGCTLQNCKYTAGNYEGDYENLNSEEGKSHRKSAQLQQPVPGNHRRRYERSFSPPRSSNSSGYGTGSSSKSFLGPDSRFPVNPEGTMTSSSSGHSSDDRWYELSETPDIDTNIHKGSTPPPLPARIASGGNQQPSAFQNVTPKRSVEHLSHSVSQLQLSQNHPPHNHSTPAAVVHHNKIQVSHSLPLPHANFSLPLNANTHNTYADYEHDYKLSEKLGMKTSSNDARPLPRTANIEYLVTRAPKIAEYTIINQHGELSKNHLDGHSTDTSSVSDKVVGLPSEDELSAGSGNVSPRLRRSSKHRGGGQLTPSSNNSRNHSPRPANGETRLRPGVTSRSNRNSANLSSSTLQEDLMKLINPDYMTAEENMDVPQQQQQQSYINGVSRSRENLNTTFSVHPNSQAEVIFTMARPATVISNASTASSPAPPCEFKLTKEERLSPRVTNNKNMMNLTPEPLPLPDAGDMDWPSLVDTATRAMLQVRDDLENNLAQSVVLEVNQNGRHWEDMDVDPSLGIDASLTSTVSSSASVPELQSHLTELESRMTLEQRRRKSLEDEVRRLREENRRLQDESQAAAHQLRRFTEWFFQTIDRQ